MLGVEVGGVVRISEVLVDIVSVLLETALEPVTRPLQGVLDLRRSIVKKRVHEVLGLVVCKTQRHDIGSLFRCTETEQGAGEGGEVKRGLYNNHEVYLASHLKTCLYT